MLILCSALTQKKGASAKVWPRPSVSAQSPVRGEQLWTGHLESLGLSA